MPAEQAVDQGAGAGSRAGSSELEIREIARDPGGRVESHFRAAATGGPRLEIVGWVLGVESPAAEIEVVSGGEVAGRSPVVLDRPDVAKLFPAMPEAATAGFRIALDAEGSGESELEVRVRLRDESRERLGRVRVSAGRRGLLDTLRHD
jgi:hypothetical protein